MIKYGGVRMNKKHNKAGNTVDEHNLEHAFKADRPHRNRKEKMARIMAIVMIVLMVGFSFITAGIFLLD
jgi:hypothetical protein